MTSTPPRTSFYYNYWSELHNHDNHGANTTEKSWFCMNSNWKWLIVLFFEDLLSFTIFCVFWYFLTKRINRLFMNGLSCIGKPQNYNVNILSNPLIFSKFLVSIIQIELSREIWIAWISAISAVVAIVKAQWWRQNVSVPIKKKSYIEK